MVVFLRWPDATTFCQFVESEENNSEGFVLKKPVYERPAGYCVQFAEF
jgi:hypothetical protein